MRVEAPAAAQLLPFCPCPCVCCCEQKVEFDVQVKIEHGLAEFLTTRTLTPTHRPTAAAQTGDSAYSPPTLCVPFVRRVSPLQRADAATARRGAESGAGGRARQVLRPHPPHSHSPRSALPCLRCILTRLSLLCASQTSAHPFPTFPESVSDMYHRYQSTFLTILSTCPASTLILVTHGYGLQVLTEFMSPTTLVTSTGPTVRLHHGSGGAQDRRNPSSPGQAQLASRTPGARPAADGLGVRLRAAVRCGALEGGSSGRGGGGGEEAGESVARAGAGREERVTRKRQSRECKHQQPCRRCCDVRTCSVLNFMPSLCNTPRFAFHFNQTREPKLSAPSPLAPPTDHSTP